MARVFAAGGPPPGGLPVTIVAAASPVHSSGFAAAAARGYPVRMTGVPATLPIGEIVRRLNDAPPAALLAHTSTLVLLAAEQHAGRLQISPQAITAISELLTDQDRNAIREAFGVPPVSGFVSTEGLAGHTQPGGAVMRFATDMCMVELVDARNQPVTDGAIVADGTLDHAGLASSLQDSLHTAGLREPHVHVHEVAAIARHPQTGKTRRFIPR